VGRITVGLPPRPLAVFDGQCGFCRFWVERWRGRLAGKVDFESFQQVAERFPEMSVDDFRQAFQLIEPDGAVSAGADGIYRLLTHAGRCVPLWIHRHVPGAAAISEAGYRFVADHRPLADRVRKALLGRNPEPSTFARSARLFRRLTALSYLASFLSLWVQIDALVGSRGILPAASFLGLIRRELGSSAYWAAPTLLWLGASDAALHALCAGGVLLSVLVFLEVAPALGFALLWGLSLSLSVAGQQFLEFQWDALLLEAGFLAIWISPLRLAPGPPAEPPRAARLLIVWLAFQLVFFSGVVKLASGDPSWRSLTALRVHFQTQPLPTQLEWLAHQLPGRGLDLMTLTMFAIELGAPFFLFGPRRLRAIAVSSLVALQVVIAATGNYAFFNLLAVALCLAALDDQSLPGGRCVPPGARFRNWPRGVLAPVAVLIVLVSTTNATSQLGWRPPRPAALLSLIVEPFRSINRYGLFAVMTTTRPEIVVEGSDDGVQWKEYEFRWKPGDPSRAPHWVAPHQPRLDWQMWFAALGGPEQSPWFSAFLRRLLEGEPAVRRLLARDPFAPGHPRLVRALLYDYRFTTIGEMRRTGAWWSRRLLGEYYPAASLPGGENSR